VNNLPKVVTRKQNGRKSNPPVTLISSQCNAMTVTLQGRSVGASDAPLGRTGTWAKSDFTRSTQYVASVTVCPSVLVRLFGSRSGNRRVCCWGPARSRGRYRSARHAAAYISLSDCKEFQHTCYECLSGHLPLLTCYKFIALI